MQKGNCLQDILLNKKWKVQNNVLSVYFLSSLSNFLIFIERYTVFHMHSLFSELYPSIIDLLSATLFLHNYFFSLKTCLHFLNCITLQLYFLYSTINLFLNLHLNFFYLNIFLVPTSTATIENEIRILLYGFLFLNLPEMLSFSPFSEFPVHYYVVINSEHTHTYTQT